MELLTELRHLRAFALLDTEVQLPCVPEDAMPLNPEIHTLGLRHHQRL